MQQRTIGPYSVSAIGLGGMPMSIEGRPDQDRSVATIHAALDAGVTLIDTADAYHLRRRRGRAQRGAHRRRPCGPTAATPTTCSSPPRAATCAPATARGPRTAGPSTSSEAAPASAQRLGVEAIGLYQFHRPDPTVPYADSVGALVELLDEGVIQLAGISNAHVEQIDEAQRGARRSARVGAEPVLPGVPQQPGRAASTAPSWASRSCRGPRSAASPAPASSAPGTARSSRSPTRTASARSRSRSPGSSRSRRS